MIDTDKKETEISNKPATDNLIKEDNASIAVQKDTSGKKDAPTAKKTTKQKTSAKKVFSVAILAGGDISTVKMNYAEPLGINAGFVVGYHFNKKWSVHTGLIYTHKNYELNGKDFSPKGNLWYNTISMKHVNGFCKMWEWPVYGRYTFGNGKKTNWLVSTGLSSYFMKREDYDYSYTYGSSPVVYNRSYIHNSNKKYFFGVAHFSAGIQRTINNKWNLIAEPYAKLPLQKVGFGNIALSSFGINFSLQLKQPVKR